MESMAGEGSRESQKFSKVSGVVSQSSDTPVYSQPSLTQRGARRPPRPGRPALGVVRAEPGAPLAPGVRHWAPFSETFSVSVVSAWIILIGQIAADAVPPPPPEVLQVALGGPRPGLTTRGTASRTSMTWPIESAASIPSSQNWPKVITSNTYGPRKVLGRMGSR